MMRPRFSRELSRSLPAGAPHAPTRCIDLLLAMTRSSDNGQKDQTIPQPERAALFDRLQGGFSSLRARLILPYVLLTLILALIGLFVIMRLVTSSVRERFVNQLYEAGRVAADGVVRREQEHLSALRLMTFTVGIPDAVLARDSDAITALVWPLALNEGMDAVVVLDTDGREIVGLTKDLSDGSYRQTSGADFSGHDFVARTMAHGTDLEGDKFVGVVDTNLGPVVFTSAPIEDEDGNLRGIILAGTYASRLAQELKVQSLADIILIDTQGTILSTTFPGAGSGQDPISIMAPAEVPVGSTVVAFELFERDFQAAYLPWVARGEVLGTLGVALPSDFIVSTEATSRNLFALVFAAGTVAVVVIGFLLAQSIALPILRLRTMAMSVAAGELDQKSGVSREDEIGDLAESFDVMTERLKERTEEARRLYEETLQRNRELAEMYERLQSAQQQLVQSEKLAAVGQLAAGIVHDVKNPLGVIKGMAEELMLDSDDEPEMQSGLQVIRDNANRANLIVTDLLKFARQSTPTMQQRDLRETVGGSLRLTDYLIRKGGVTVELRLPEKPVWVTYDAQQIEQVIINLIQNAVQAMPEGGLLNVNLSENEELVELTVEDSGTGIKAEELSHIFEPFFTTKPEGQGTGMGLAVSYGIISRHGGRIDVDSQPGQGATFVIVLPKEPVSQENLDSEGVAA